MSGRVPLVVIEDGPARECVPVNHHAVVGVIVLVARGEGRPPENPPTVAVRIDVERLRRAHPQSGFHRLLGAGADSGLVPESVDGAIPAGEYESERSVGPDRV